MSGATSLFSFVPEMFGLTGTAASVATGLTTAAAGYSAAKAMKPSVPEIVTPKTQGPPPQPPQMQGPSAEVVSEQKREARRRTQTIQTSPLGILQRPPTRKKQLLGE